MKARNFGAAMRHNTKPTKKALEIQKKWIERYGAFCPFVHPISKAEGMSPEQCPDYKKGEHCHFNEKRGLMKWVAS